MSKKGVRTRSGNGVEESSDRTRTTGKKGRLDKLARLVVRPVAMVADGPFERMKEAVLQQFRRKAAAVGLSIARLEHFVHRILVEEVRAGRCPFAPEGFVTVVGTGAVKTIIPWGVADPPEADGRSGGLDRRKKKPRWLTVQFAKPGYVVGLTPIARGYGSRKFAAMAHCNSLIAVMGRDVIADVLAETPPAARLMMVAYHCRALSRMIVAKSQLLPLTIRERLRHEIIQLARDFPLSGHPGAINLTLRHRDLAELIGTTRTTVAHNIGMIEDVLHFDRTLRRYVVIPELLKPADVVPTGPQAAAGFRADESERETFKKSLQWATRHVGLPRAVFDVLVEGAELRAYVPGDVIGVDDRLYSTVLVSGAARILVRVSSNRDVGVWIAKPGHFIGAGWISDAGARIPAFHAIAHDTGNGATCQVAVLRQEVMLKAMAALSVDQLLQLLGYLHDALSRQLYDRTVMLPLGNAERLLYQLHVLAFDFPASTADGTIIDLPLNLRRDLAPLVATDAWGIARAKRELEQAGRISILDDGRILVIGLYVTRSVA